MKHAFVGLAALVAVSATGTLAQAGPASDAFGKCLVESSTGKDRIVVMQWFFAALSANPSVQSFANATEAQRAEATKRAAAVFQRLVFVDCHDLAVAAVKQDGNQAFETSFEVFGRSAASELMSDPAVAKQISSLGDYTDSDKWTALAAEAKK